MSMIGDKEILGDQRAWDAESRVAVILGMEHFLEKGKTQRLGEYNGRLVGNYELDRDAPFVHALSWAITREVSTQELSERIAGHAGNHLVELGRYDILANPEWRAELESLAERAGGEDARINILFAGISGFIRLMQERALVHPDALVAGKDLTSVEKERIISQMFALFAEINELEHLSLVEPPPQMQPGDRNRQLWDLAWTRSNVNETMEVLVQIPFAIQQKLAAEDRLRHEPLIEKINKQIGVIACSSALNDHDGIFRPRPIIAEKDPSLGLTR